MTTRIPPRGTPFRIRPLLLLAIVLFGSTTAAEPSCPTIVSQAPYITHSLNWLGLDRCIVGVSRYDELELPHTGGLLDPDPEMLALLEPDLWFTSDWADAETIEAATPPGTRAFRLDGFGGMAQVEENLKVMGTAAGIPDIERRVAQFAADWRRRAAALDGRGTRVLLLSACGGTPYSYGRGTWMFDLFSEAGFRVLEDTRGLRHLTPGAPLSDVNALLDRFRPELVFIFANRGVEQCPLLAARLPVRVVALDNGLFMHPAPRLLEGLAALERQAGAWASRPEISP